jgi:hypothetical protein
MRPGPGRGLLQRTVVPIQRAAGNSREVHGGKLVEESTQAAQTVQPDFFAESSHLTAPPTNKQPVHPGTDRSHYEPPRGGGLVIYADFSGWLASNHRLCAPRNLGISAKH